MNQSVLTVKYRPQIFKDVIGQDIACRILSRSSSEGTPAPAYILSGTRGVGKTTLARIFAKSLNCKEAPTAEPCTVCSNCIRIANGSFIDVVELDAASHRSIDDIRDLRENVGFSPMEGKYKIFILDEAHMLTKEAYNALLKTLEEPPKYVTFIFASTDIQKFPATIISRCQHIVLRAVPNKLLIQHLSYVLDKEKYTYTEEALSLIANRGAGSVRDCLSLLGQVLIGVDGNLTKVSIEEMLGLASDDIFIQLLDAIITGDCIAVVEIVSFLQESGTDIKYFLQELSLLWRVLFLYKQNGEKAFSVLTLSEEKKIIMQSVAQKLSLSQIHASWQMLLNGQKRIVESLEPGIALELLLLNLVSFSSLFNIKALSTNEQNIILDSKSHNTISTIKGNTEAKSTVSLYGEQTKGQASAIPENILIATEKNSATESIPSEAIAVETKREITKVENKGNTAIYSFPIFLEALSSDTKVQQLAMHIRTGMFKDTSILIYAASTLALQKLSASREALESFISTLYPTFTLVLKSVDEADAKMLEIIENNSLIQRIEKEFSTKCEFTPKKY